MLTTTITLLATFAGLVHSECKTFENTTGVFAQFPNVFGKSLYKDNETFGIPIYNHVQQVSPGYTCKDPESFDKHEPHNSWGAYTSFWCADGYFGGRPQCLSKVQGNVYTRAMTNLSITTPQDHKASHRIIELMIKQMRFHTLFQYKNFHYDLQFEYREIARESAACLKQGESGYNEFAPAYYCLAGVLKDCDRGSKLEQDGQQLAACIPILFAGNGNGDYTRIEGTYFTKYTTKAEAEKHRSNPALKVPAPNSGNLGNAPSSYIALFFLVISVLSGL